MKFSRKQKILIVSVVLMLLGASFIPMWTDPFHEKDEPIIFWEWLYKEIWELIYGEKPVSESGD